MDVDMLIKIRPEGMQGDEDAVVNVSFSSERFKDIGGYFGELIE